MAALNISKKQVCRLCYSWFHRHNLSFQRHDRQPTHGDVDARIYGRLGCAPTAVFITIDPVDNWRRKRSSSRTATVRCSYHYLDRYAYILPIGSMFLANAVCRARSPILYSNEEGWSPRRCSPGPFPARCVDDQTSPQKSAPCSWSNAGRGPAVAAADRGLETLGRLRAILPRWEV